MSSTGKLERQYAAAEENPFREYLQLGNGEQPPHILGPILQAHRDNPDSHQSNPLSHAAICIELAFAASTPLTAERFLDEAADQFEEMANRTEAHAQGMDYVRRGAILESFMPRIRREVVMQERPSLHDERAIWLGMTGLLADSDLAVLQTKKTAPIVNAEITLHALVARNNLRRDTIRHQTWQALPRTAFFDRSKGKKHTEWNAAVTRGDAGEGYKRLLVRQGADCTVRGTVAEGTTVANITHITGVEPLVLMDALRSEVAMGNPAAHPLLDKATRDIATFASLQTMTAQSQPYSA